MANLPPIPAKRYFTISEVALLCDVKPHVLRYWEQEFVQLRPMKRRGNRRYYQHHELLMVRRIRSLLYEEGFTIQGARNQLRGSGVGAEFIEDTVSHVTSASPEDTQNGTLLHTLPLFANSALQSDLNSPAALQTLRSELVQIRSLLSL